MKRESLYPKKKLLVADGVKAFLSCGDSALDQSRGDAFGFDGMDRGTAIQNARRAWSAMQRARLFCFDPERWAALHDVADRYVYESLAKTPHSGRSHVHLRPKEVFAAEKLWGISEAEAVRKGYASAETPVTDAGWAAFEKDTLRNFLDKPGFRQMMDVYVEAFEKSRWDIASIALIQIFEAMERPADADYEKLVSAYEDYGVRWPFPGQLPFDAVFLSFGMKLNLVLSPDPLHARIHASELSDLGARNVYLLGYLLSWEGDEPFIFSAVQFDMIEEDGSPAVGVGFSSVYEGGEWMQPMTNDPWIISMLVNSINDHKQIVESHPASLSSRTARKDASKRRKELLPLPAPFYVVDLKDEFVSRPHSGAARRVSGRAIEWSHRWDVRGHECIRIERGVGPADPKEVTKLKKRGYRVYEAGEISADDAARLVKRGVRAPGPEEWIAVLSYWRDAYLKGPEGRPYVPAARAEAS